MEGVSKKTIGLIAIGIVVLLTLVWALWLRHTNFYVSLFEGNAANGVFSCAPATQTVDPHVDAAMSISDGNGGPYNWSTPHGTPSTGTGASFTTQFSSGGTYTVTVTEPSHTATCTVVVNTITTTDPCTSTAAINRATAAQLIVTRLGLPMVVPQAPDFADVDSSLPEYRAIETLYQGGITAGCATGPLRYCPTGLVTRAQFVTFAVRALGYTLINPTTPHFSDVPTTYPFYKEIETAYAHGLIAGYTDGTFRPDQNVTGVEACAIATPRSTPTPTTTATPTVTATVTPTPTTTGTPPPKPLTCSPFEIADFSDVGPDSQYYEAVTCLRQNYCVTVGVGGGQFSPARNIMRWEAVAFIANYHVNILKDWQWVSPTTPSFSDVGFSFPAYVHIETAKKYGYITGNSDGTFRPLEDWFFGGVSETCGLTKPCAYSAPISRANHIKSLYDYGMAHSQLSLCKLSCSPATQPAGVNATLGFTAQHGTKGTYTWSAPNGSPAEGSTTSGFNQNSSFSTKYSSIGSDNTEDVTVTNYSQTAVCSVTLSIGATSTPTPTPGVGDLSIEKLGEDVTKQDSGPHTRIDASPGDIVRFTLNITSQSNTNLTNVIIRDVLPSQLVYEPGTTKVNGVPYADGITVNGITINMLSANGSIPVTFNARIGTGEAFQTGTTVLINTAYAKADGVIEHDAKLPIYVTKNVLVPVGQVQTGVDGFTLTILLSLFLTFVYHLAHSGFGFMKAGNLATTGIASPSRNMLTVVAVLFVLLSGSLVLSGLLRSSNLAYIELRNPTIHNADGTSYGLIGKFFR